MSNKIDKLKQLRAFQRNTDKSLQELIDEAYHILGNPIILYDADWKILAHAENVIIDDPFWNNHTNDGTVYNKNFEAFLNEGFIDIMMRPDNVVLLQSENIKYDRLFGKIFDNDNNVLAGVSVVASYKPFEDYDLKATEIICKALSPEILKIPYYQGYTQVKIETCINMLITKKIEGVIDRTYASGYVEMVYRGLKEYLYIAVSDISQCDPTYTKLEYFRDLFKQTRPAFKYSIYSNYIVFIMSTNEELFYPRRCLNRLNKVFIENNINVGISRRFGNLFELSRYYGEAVNALNYGLKDNSGQRIFVYSEENFSSNR